MIFVNFNNGRQLKLRHICLSIKL